MPQRYQRTWQVGNPHSDYAELRYVSETTAWTPVTFNHTTGRRRYFAPTVTMALMRGKSANHLPTTQSRHLSPYIGLDTGNVQSLRCRCRHLYANCHNGTTARAGSATHVLTAVPRYPPSHHRLDTGNIQPLCGSSRVRARLVTTALPR